ncbi:MAG: asparagine synthase (glutamine-hydrolyzing) [Burkholderiales bacterium]|nr:asparagine synthase (glutamine-hydrolyzing) [Burkholderiales bacterium]
MCGIHGIYQFDGQRVQPQWLSAMGNVTTHRGPDDEGQHIDGNAAIAMRRLSIIDLAGGHQPISNADNTLWVVCNGEIFNFRELRAELQAKGYAFKTGSDSEVLLHLYDAEGDDFVHRLNGMYDFALWDARRRRLLIGRDRLGVKPLYVMQDGQRLAFATEAKALLALPGASTELDRNVVAGYLHLGYVAAPQSIFKGIRKLPPATLLSVESGQVREWRYWRLPQRIETGVSDREWIDRIRSQMEASVEMQMVSDVPIGAFLSGGVDSSAVVGFMAKHTPHPVRTYSIGFEGGAAETLYNELPYARQVAQLFGTQHREIVVKPDVVGLLPRLLWHRLRSLVAGAARQLPADRHSGALNMFRLAKGFIASAEMEADERYRSYLQMLPRAAVAGMLMAPQHGQHAGRDALAEAFAGAGHGDDHNRMFGVDCETQLPDDLLMLTDKMSMAVSLECRVPLLDHALVELASAIPAAQKMRDGELKHLMKSALADLLPRDILYRAKRGFGTPMGAWLKKELRPLLRQLLAPEVVARRGLFRQPLIDQLVADHEANRIDGTDALIALMNLEIWSRIYLDRHSHEDVAADLKRHLAEPVAA